MEIEEYQLLKQKVISANIPVGKKTRFANYIIDLFTLLVLDIVFFLIAPLILDESTLVFIVELPDIVLGSILSILYYFSLEFFTNRTLGKLVTGTSVIAQSGEKPSVSQILIRTLSRLIPFEVLSFLFDDRGWHDKISKTFVVKTK